MVERLLDFCGIGGEEKKKYAVLCMQPSYDLDTHHPSPVGRKKLSWIRNVKPLRLLTVCCVLLPFCLALHACRFHSLLAYSLTPFLRSWFFVFFFCLCLFRVNRRREKIGTGKTDQTRKREKENEFRIDCRRSFVSLFFYFYFFGKTKYIVRI